jgi:hypothetical protein
MEEDDLQRLYVWLDEIPLSRPKRSIARDFSDGGERGVGVMLLFFFLQTQSVFVALTRCLAA